MASTREKTTQRFKARVDMPLPQQLTVAVIALREKADGNGEIDGAKQAEAAILGMLAPYGANEGNAVTIRRKLLEYGLLDSRRNGRGTIYTVNPEPPVVSDELLKQYKAEARARRREAKKARQEGADATSSNGVDAPATQEDPVDEMGDLIAGLEVALAQAVQERDEALAALGRQKDEASDLRQQLRAALDRIATLEEEQRRARQRADEILASYRTPSSNGSSAGSKKKTKR